MNHEETYSLQELIRWALAEQTDREIDALPTPAELDEMFPDTARFRRRVFDAVKAQEKAEKRAKRRILPIVKRTLLVAAILAALLFGTLMTNASVRSAVINTIFEWTGRDVGIYFQVEGQPPAALPEDYGPHYIPERFEYQENLSQKNSRGLFYMYKTQDQQSALIVQIQIAENKSFYRIDTGHAVYEKITFEDVPAYLGHAFTEDNKKAYVMIWVKDGVEYNIYGEVSLSDLFEIAENIY